MSVLNIGNAISLLESGKTVTLTPNGFAQEDLKGRIIRKLSREADKREILKIANFVKDELTSPSSAYDKQALVVLGDACIHRFRAKKSVQKSLNWLDRYLIPHRNERECHSFKMQNILKKWQDYNFPEDIFWNHPDFVLFLSDLKLIRQMKISKEIEIQLVDDEPAINVEGTYVKWTELKRKFKLEKSSRFKDNFIVNQQTHDVYTYLPNGEGLQKYHPYNDPFKPVTYLDKNEYQSTLEKAQQFIRPEESELSKEDRAKKNQERPYIFQIVVNRTEEQKTNFGNFILRPKHAYLRLIVGEDDQELGRKGAVYNCGFLPKGKLSLPLMAIQGDFRSPDVYEYTPLEKVVTNIPLTKENAHSLFSYMRKYQRDSVNLGHRMGFHFGRQNCTVFVRYAAKACGIEIPTEVTFTEMLANVVPDWIKAIGKAMSKALSKAKQGVLKSVSYLPESWRTAVKKAFNKIHELAHRAFDAIAAISLIPARFVTGDGLGEGGRAFATEEEDSSDVQTWKSYFNLSNYKANSPAKLVEWQLEQLSTFRTAHPVKLAIVPQEEEPVENFSELSDDGDIYTNNLKNWEFGKACARSLIQQSSAEAAQLE